MVEIREVATLHPVVVLTTTRADDAARLMGELGIGDVIVTDPVTGAVGGMLTDRDIAVRLVGSGLDAPSTEVSKIYTPNAATIGASEDVGRALELMRSGAVRRLPVVDADGRPIGIVSVEDLARSDQVSDSEFRETLRALAEAYRANRISATRP